MNLKLFLSLTVLSTALVLNPAAFGGPATNWIWRNTDNLPGGGRVFHTATLLPNGLVLVTGGRQGMTQRVSATAELYDFATGTWTYTGAMTTARAGHTATLLANGMVLVTGGYDQTARVLSSSELYNPATGTWSLTGNFGQARFDHTATLLPNGMVLLAGGVSPALEPLKTAILYNTATGSWTKTGA